MDIIQKTALIAAKAFLVAKVQEEADAESALWGNLAIGEPKPPTTESRYPEAALIYELIDAVCSDEGEEVDGVLRLVKQDIECFISITADGSEALIRTPNTYWSHKAPTPVFN